MTVRDILPEPWRAISPTVSSIHTIDRGLVYYAQASATFKDEQSITSVVKTGLGSTPDDAKQNLLDSIANYPLTVTA